MRKLVLIDGNSIMNRAYFALPPLTDKKGLNVNAVYGFMNILLKILSDIDPTSLIVTFDMKGKNFRHEIYPLYKANRKGMADDLFNQMPVIHKVLEVLGITVIESEGVEADDIIGTIAKTCGCDCYIVSGDRDLLQLIDEKTVVWLTKRGVTEVEVNDKDSIFVNHELSPAQIIDYKALCGDSSDNIPGVRGIGDKTAKNLILSYENLDGIYQNIDEIKGALKTKLIEGKEMAYMSQKLAEIVTNVPIEYQIDTCDVKKEYSSEAYRVLDELEFNSIIKRMKFEDIHDKSISCEVVEIDSVDKLKEILKERNEEKRIAINLEEWQICFAFDKLTEYRTVGEGIFANYLVNQSMEVLKAVIEGDKEKVVFDAKSFMRMAMSFGVNAKNITHDISILSYLANDKAFSKIDSVKNSFNCQEDAVSLLIAGEELLKDINAKGLNDLYMNVELPLVRVLFEMENEGVKLDKEVCRELDKKYSLEIERLSEEVYKLAGKTFNVLSPKQLAVVLFDDLKLKHGKKTKTGYSTDMDTLVKLKDQHPIIDYIIEIRKYSKLKGTYIDGLIQWVDETGIIHTTYNQTLTTTGRLSSSNPNLQNIPVRDEMGKEIRLMFIPKYDCLIGADYSQIELRLLAHFSQDEVLINAFNNGEDIHRRVASEIFDIPMEMVSSSMRRTAKAVNFGIIYGISDFGLSENIGITLQNARKYIQKYYQRYPKIKEYLSGSVQYAREKGYVSTILGRRRYMNDINSSNFQARSFQERASMNMPLQGSAADIMKIAMINVFNRINKENLKSKLIMQIHDELIIDTVAEEKEKVKKVLIEEMQNAYQTRVLLSADIEEGNNLYEMK